MHVSHILVWNQVSLYTHLRRLGLSSLSFPAVLFGNLISQAVSDNYRKALQYQELEQMVDFYDFFSFYIVRVSSFLLKNCVHLHAFYSKCLPFCPQAGIFQMEKGILILVKSIQLLFFPSSFKNPDLRFT